MKRAKRTELRIRRNGEQKVGCVHNKTTKPKTFTDGVRPRAPCWNYQNIYFRNCHSDPLIRGRFARQNFYHKEHKEHKEMKGGNGVREANLVTLPLEPR